MTLRASTQVPHKVKAYLARLLNRPPRNLRVIAPDVGGGFGQKMEVWPEDVALSYLAVMLARSIKWIEERRENMLAYHGRGHAAEVEAAVKRDGSILGMRFRIVADVGAYFITSTPGPVEVDRDTGQVSFLRYAAVHDCGRVINPKLLEGQVYGAVAQGLGQALTEVMAYSPEGQPLSGSFLDYAIPVADDVPTIKMDILQTPSPTNPLAVKGIGELPTVAAPVAVANAVLDALSSFGVRRIDTPLTAEKIWRAMQAPRPSLPREGEGQGGGDAQHHWFKKHAV